jgi:hypothetical protein
MSKSKVFDPVDGGIAATFADGPKQGHLGVVTATDGMPPATLTFLEDLVYLRHKRAKVKAIDGMTGQPVTYRGVVYRMDPKCGFVAKIRLADREAKAEGTAQAIERGEITP